MKQEMIIMKQESIIYNICINAIKKIKTTWNDVIINYTNNNEIENKLLILYRQDENSNYVDVSIKDIFYNLILCWIDNYNLDNENRWSMFNLKFDKDFNDNKWDINFYDYDLENINLFRANLIKSSILDEIKIDNMPMFPKINFDEENINLENKVNDLEDIDTLFDDESIIIDEQSNQIESEFKIDKIDNVLDVPEINLDEETIEILDNISKEDEQNNFNDEESEEIFLDDKNITEEMNEKIISDNDLSDSNLVIDSVAIKNDILENFNNQISYFQLLDLVNLNVIPYKIMRKGKCYVWNNKSYVEDKKHSIFVNHLLDSFRVDAVLGEKSLINSTDIKIINWDRED